MMTDEEFSHSLTRLLRSARLVNWPRRRVQRDYLLISIALMFEPDREYSEDDVNETVKEWLNLVGNAVQIDHVNIRRELVDRKILDRDDAGTSYKLSRAFLLVFGEALPETDIRRLLKSERSHPK